MMNYRIVIITSVCMPKIIDIIFIYYTYTTQQVTCNFALRYYVVPKIKSIIIDYKKSKLFDNLLFALLKHLTIVRYIKIIR